MKAVRLLAAVVMLGVACQFGYSMDHWDLLRTFTVRPITAYAIKVVGVAVLVFIAGLCCGAFFNRTSYATNAFGGVFVVLMIFVIAVPALGIASAPVLEVYANGSLIVYVSAALAGVACGSSKE